MTSFNRALVAWLACLALGCGGLANGSTSDVGAPKAGDAGGSSSAAGDEVAPPLPELPKQPIVWVGEMSGTITYPEDAAYSGWGSGPPQKIVLILGAASALATGTVTFGDHSPPPPPVDAKQPYPPEPTTFTDSSGRTNPVLSGNWMFQLYDGFAYSISSSGLSGNALSLTFLPSSIWRDWCPLQDPATGQTVVEGGPFCDCNATVCRAPIGATRELDLVVSGDTMQGQILGLGGGANVSDPVAVKLQRVR